MADAARTYAKDHWMEGSPYGHELVRIGDRFDTKLTVDMIHGFINMPGVLDAAHECLEACGMRLQRVFAQPA